MRRRVRIITNLITVIAILIYPSRSYAMDFTYVDVSQQIYSYDAMVEDMVALSTGHEDYMSYSPIATTSQGRSVWLIKFGNLAAENKVLITASIHAREYMSSQLVMRMLEEYVLNFDVPNQDGITYRQMFDSVCFYILPMVNPDGVSISQFDAALRQIKSNANGVDLNRNFPIGFGLDPYMRRKPGLEYYPGVAPLSEAETQGIAKLLEDNAFCAGINYHSKGNIVYYGASTNSPEVAAGCKAMADAVRAITGYKSIYCGNAIGSLADYFGTVEAAPSVTIEIGTASPVPISQFTRIYNRNLPVWTWVANLF